MFWENFTLLKTIKSYNLRMKIKQLVIFTILNYISIRKYSHNFITIVIILIIIILLIIIIIIIIINVEMIIILQMDTR